MENSKVEVLAKAALALLEYERDVRTYIRSVMGAIRRLQSVESPTQPEVRKALERLIRRKEVKSGGWGFGVRYELVSKLGLDNARLEALALLELDVLERLGNEDMTSHRVWSRLRRLVTTPSLPEVRYALVRLKNRGVLNSWKLDNNDSAKFNFTLEERAARGIPADPYKVNRDARQAEWKEQQEAKKEDQKAVEEWQDCTTGQLSQLIIRALVVLRQSDTDQTAWDAMSQKVQELAGKKRLPPTDELRVSLGGLGRMGLVVSSTNNWCRLTPKAIDAYI